MEFISNIKLHLTIYITQEYICLRGFNNHGTSGKGGIEIISKRDVSFLNSELLNSINQPLLKELYSLLNTLYEQFYNYPTAIDIELIIDKLENIYVLQIRRLCPQFIHISRKAHEMKKPNIKSGHILFTIGSFVGKLLDIKKSRKITSDSIYWVNHDQGKGTLDFLSRLSKMKERVSRLVIFIIHSKENQTHDHLMYSILEDPRIMGVFHVFENDVKRFKNKRMKIISSGLSMKLLTIPND